MTRTRKDIEQQLTAAKAAALRLLSSPDGERLIHYLEVLWTPDGRRAAANHGDAGWALAMHQAVEDLKRLREEGTTP